MKRKVVLLAGFFLTITLFYSCAKDETCKDCRSITVYGDGTTPTETSGYTEYCDSDLDDVDGKTITIGENTVTYQCK